MSNGVSSNPAKHTLWQPTTDGLHAPKSVWYLRVSVLKDKEDQGDCPSRKFVSAQYSAPHVIERAEIVTKANSTKQEFESLHHLTHATNQLRTLFTPAGEIRKSGVDTRDPIEEQWDGTHGCSETLTIEYDSAKAGQLGWKEFLAQLTSLQNEWEHEGMSMS